MLYLRHAHLHVSLKRSLEQRHTTDSVFLSSSGEASLLLMLNGIGHGARREERDSPQPQSKRCLSVNPRLKSKSVAVYSELT